MEMTIELRYTSLVNLSTTLPTDKQQEADTPGHSVKTSLGGTGMHIHTPVSQLLLSYKDANILPAQREPSCGLQFLGILVTKTQYLLKGFRWFYS